MADMIDVVAFPLVPDCKRGEALHIWYTTKERAYYSNCPYTKTFGTELTLHPLKLSQQTTIM